MIPAGIDDLRAQDVPPARDPKISVIVPTLGRTTQLGEFLESAANQDLPKESFEVIVIDQNESGILEPIIAGYQDRIDVRHLRTPVKGIARAKNMGIQASRAEIVTFADDDARYYTDTLSAALGQFREHPAFDIIYGRVFDRTNKRNILRIWRKKNLKLNIFNFSLHYAAITCFTKRKDLAFDERFGMGTSYMMGEELDYLIRALREGKCKVLYTPEIDIWHPDSGAFVADPEKVLRYSIGYGAICRKNLDPSIAFIFALSIGYQLTLALYHLLRSDPVRTKSRLLAVKGRLKGLLAA